MSYFKCTFGDYCVSCTKSNNLYLILRNFRLDLFNFVFKMQAGYSYAFCFNDRGVFLVYLHAPSPPQFLLHGGIHTKGGVIGREHAGDTGAWCHGQGHSSCLGDRGDRNRLGLELGWERKWGDNLAAPTGALASWSPPLSLLAVCLLPIADSRTGWHLWSPPHRDPNLS